MREQLKLVTMTHCDSELQASGDLDRARCETAARLVWDAMVCIRLPLAAGSGPASSRKHRGVYLPQAQVARATHDGVRDEGCAVAVRTEEQSPPARP